MGQRVCQHRQFLHQSADPIEHLIDLSRQPIERIVGSRNRDTLLEIASRDSVSDRCNPPDPPADIAREYDSARGSEED